MMSFRENFVCRIVEFILMHTSYILSGMTPLVEAISAVVRRNMLYWYDWVIRLSNKFPNWLLSMVNFTVLQKRCSPCVTI